jgi:myo-inositol-1(or 4)-monophosphatase
VERGLELARSRAGAADIASKGERDLVTATDVAVEDVIREHVASVGYPVVGEERGGEAPTDGSPYWLVDPICGTRNFASGIPLFSMNLALVEDHHVTVAVVGDGSTGEVCVAEQGEGAWSLQDGERQRLATSVESLTVAIEDSRSEGARRELSARFMAEAICEDRWDLRALGTTLSLAHVATGRIAAYVLFWSTPLHSAAGVLLAAEAGATVSRIDGWPWTLGIRHVVVSVDRRAPELLRIAGGLRTAPPGMPESSAWPCSRSRISCPNGSTPSSWRAPTCRGGCSGGG